MAKALKLRFVAGKYEGGEFRLPAEGEVIIGRGAELPVVLAEDMVSRKHARLTIQGERIRIEDLGSTNGTFVNGERVKASDVKIGDRILIGTSIMKLLATEVPDGRPARATTGGVATARQAPPKLAPATQAMSAMPHTTVPPPQPEGTPVREPRVSTGSVKTVAGSIEEIPLPDILQLFASSRKTGLLVVKCGGQRANLYIENGQVVHVQIEGLTQSRSRKCINRVLRWKTGSFELRPAKSIPQGDRLTEKMEHLLMDGLRELDEIERLRPDLPADEAPLALAVSLTPKLRDLLPSTLDILQAVHNEKQLLRVMDAFPEMTDLDVAMEVVLLIQKGYVTVQK